MHDYFFVFLLIFCDFPLCYKIFGTIDYSISLFGNLRDLWKVLSWWSKCIQLFSHLSIYPGELLWDIFCTFLRIFVFFYVPVFFENHSVASYQFLTDAPGIFWRLTLLKESFQNISSSAGRHLKLFCRGSFWGTLLYSWRLFRFTLWNFV